MIEDWHPKPDLAPAWTHYSDPSSVRFRVMTPCHHPICTLLVMVHCWLIMCRILAQCPALRLALVPS